MWGTYRDANGSLGIRGNGGEWKDRLDVPYGMCQAILDARGPRNRGGMPTITPTTIASGDNHTLLATAEGTVFSWGAGGQGQLGRRVVRRFKRNALMPRSIRLPGKKKASAVFAGGELVSSQSERTRTE